MYWIVWSIGQHQVLARVRGTLNPAEPLAPRVDRDQLLAGNAAEIVIEFALQAAQALVIHAHIAEDLCCQFPLGIEALGLLAEADAFQVQFANTIRRVGVDLALEVDEIPVALQVGDDLLRVHVENFAQQVGGLLLVGDFAGHCKYGININGHRKGITVAVVDVATARLDRNDAVLLAFSPQHKVVVLHHL